MARIVRHNDESVREGYIRNGGKEVKLFTSALKTLQCYNRIVMAQRKHLDNVLRGRHIGRLECGRTQLEVSEELGITQSVISRLWQRFQNVDNSVTITGHIYRDVILEQHVRLFRGAMGAEFQSMNVNARPPLANIVDECLKSEDITLLVTLGKLYHTFQQASPRRYDLLLYPSSLKPVQNKQISTSISLPLPDSEKLDFPVGVDSVLSDLSYGDYADDETYEPRMMEGESSSDESSSSEENMGIFVTGKQFWTFLCHQIFLNKFISLS
ncbi:uncharacterized protein TNCV_112021 [Trichonephila clavipes]|nr:uncharacterized protein TNCV_112021 [Trichonephila clavipes]